MVYVTNGTALIASHADIHSFSGAGRTLTKKPEDALKIDQGGLRSEVRDPQDNMHYDGYARPFRRMRNTTRYWVSFVPLTHPSVFSIAKNLEIHRADTFKQFLDPDQAEKKASNSILCLGYHLPSGPPRRTARRPVASRHLLESTPTPINQTRQKYIGLPDVADRAPQPHPGRTR